MAKKSKPKSPFEGRWRITSMEMWGQDFVDAEVEGYFEFEPNGMGSFQFGYVRGEIDYREGTRDNKPSVECWDGNDEMDPAQGRGWAVIDGDEIHGLIAFHQGDESDFVFQLRDALLQTSDLAIARLAAATSAGGRQHERPSSNSCVVV